MITLGTLLRLHTKFEKPLGGCVCLSGIVPCHPKQGGLLAEGMKILPPLEEEQEKRVKETPKFIYLGDQDHFFPEIIATLNWELVSVGDKITKTIEKGLNHSVSMAELGALKAFLTDAMTEKKKEEDEEKKSEK